MPSKPRGNKDREYGSNPAAVGPLHGIPVIVKDNYNTADLPTTGGSSSSAHSRPPQDCFVVQQLRQAGALTLAKANLTELAMGGTTLSSFGGQTRNPYDVLRTPGGSSGGTAAAITGQFWHPRDGGVIRSIDAIASVGHQFGRHPSHPRPREPQWYSPHQQHAR